MSEKNNHYSLIILRAALGIIFFAHGSQKLLGWFGGYGFDATMQFFQQIGIPAIIAMLIILGEFFGGILILSGLFTRVASAWISIIMLGALFMVHLPNGFFLSGDKAGYEYVFALLFTALYLMLNGAGSLSLDRLIKNKVGNETLKKLVS
ncbi:MAG: DoxX family protein [Candidatus Methanoperedens sp.]|nr:DoxX family protein [Candidatus Methanoperedens sp.]